MYISLRHAPAIFSLLAVMFLLPVFTPSRADEDREEALSEVRSKINRLRKEIEKTQTLHDSVRTELRKVEQDISKIHRALKKLNGRLASKEKELDSLYRDRAELTRELSTHHQLLGRQIQAAYMIGQQEYLKLLLNQEDPSVVGRTMIYYDYFNRARVAEIETTQVTLQKLKRVEADIKAETVELNAIKQQRLAKQQELLKVSREHSLVVARLHDELVNKEQELAQLIENERRLTDLVNKLDEAIPDILTATGKRTPFEKLRGKLNWPTKGDVQALFGRQRSIGKLTWNGVIIRANEGRDIRAVSHGRVAYADWLRGYGLLLILDHGDGYMSLYGHNQSIYKETGEWVNTGEIIASVGKSGGQKQAGLYFEIRHNGKPRNPLKWCRHG